MTVTYSALHTAYKFSLTAGGSAHTKGSYTELVGSAPIAADGILLTTAGLTPGGRLYLVDIATGGAGSETVIVANLPYQVGDDFHMANSCVFIPIPIGAGSRIAARCQSSVASSVCDIACHLVNGDASNIIDNGVAYTYGANTGTTRGVSIDPGGTADTKGSYAELVAATSTTDPLRWLLAMFGNQANQLMSTANWSIDIATGGAGAETVIVPDLICASLASTVDGVVPSAFAVPVHIVTGTRIAARAKCTITDATDRLIDLILIGIGGTLVTGGGVETFTGSVINRGIN